MVIVHDLRAGDRTAPGGHPPVIACPRRGARRHQIVEVAGLIPGGGQQGRDVRGQRGDHSGRLGGFQQAVPRLGIFRQLGRRRHGQELRRIQHGQHCLISLHILLEDRPQGILIGGRQVQIRGHAERDYRREPVVGGQNEVALGCQRNLPGLRTTAGKLHSFNGLDAGGLHALRANRKSKGRAGGHPVFRGPPDLRLVQGRPKAGGHPTGRQKNGEDRCADFHVNFPP